MVTRLIGMMVHKYWLPHDKGIIDEVNKISSATDIKFEGNKDLIQIVGEEVDSVYLNKVKTISIDPEVIKRQKDLKIVYTPIHGTGMMLIPRALKQWGFENVHTVPEQMVKSGDFPDCCLSESGKCRGFVYGY